ncbi:MAG TPA: hypothetical protein VEU08_10245 [Vicinamibacterales bacterium]|nr:hypothetical protein [Vicinamibacterales bacterium]
MSKLLIAGMLVAVSAAAFAGDVAVSVRVGEPGFYGQIEIGNVPAPPPLVYARPVVIEAAPAYVNAPPIYLHVPPGHEKHWRKHCHEYNACGRPVYFVRDEWYNKEYVRQHRHEEERDHDRHDEHHHGHDRDDRDH